MNRRTFTRLIPSIALFAMPNTPRRTLAVFEGNSLTALNNVVSPTCWVSILLTMPFAKEMQLCGVNAAVSGDDMRQINRRASVYVDPLRTLCGVGVCVLWEGTNTLIANGLDADLTFAQHYRYCADRKRAGWRVVIGTIANRRYISVGGEDNGTHESARQRFNQLVRANWREFDAVLDVGANDKLGLQKSAWDVDYFRDGVHLTELGGQEVANIAAPVIATVLNQQYRRLFPLMLNN